MDALTISGPSSFLLVEMPGASVLLGYQGEGLALAVTDGMS